MQNRTVYLHQTIDPPYSGYGGYDEWVVENLPPEGIDELHKAIEAAMRRVARKYKTKAKWIGVS